MIYIIWGTQKNKKDCDEGSPYVDVREKGPTLSKVYVNRPCALFWSSELPRVYG